MWRRHAAAEKLVPRAEARDGQGMPQKKPLVVVTRKLPEVVEARMREIFDVRLNATTRR